MGTKRPWRVFVRDIGPTFSFKDEQAARERAQVLMQDQIVIGKHLHGPYAEIVVSGEPPRDVNGWERTIYRYGQDPWVEVFNDGQWLRKEE